MTNIVSNISSPNPALQFIDKRILSDNYRGEYSSQHNRYTMKQQVKILELLAEYSSHENLIQIRTTDLSKRSYDLPEEKEYAEFCHKVKQETGIGTQDAMRKNLFVDFHRMGLIKRYDKNKDPVEPYVRKAIKYVSLSSEGLKLIKENNFLKQYFLFSKAVDKLLGGYINLFWTS